MRRAWLTPGLLVLTLVASSCRLDDSGTGVVLTVRVQSQIDVSLLDYRLRAVDGSEPDIVGRSTVGRTVMELENRPFEITFSPLARASYVLHLVAPSTDGEVFTATRCYIFSGSLTDTVVLAGPIGSLDDDGDTFVVSSASFCIEPGPRPCGPDDFVCEAALASDCDDTDSSIFPGAPVGPNECEDGVDQDCDGDTDEGCDDFDGDGVRACPRGVTTSCDCNDNDASINPRAEDLCRDGIDQDCDGMDACCDADGDGFESCSGGVGDCVDSVDECPALEPGCDPALINPSASELCDGVDNNCNGLTDEIDECRSPDLDGDGVAVCGREVAGQPCEDGIYDCDAAIFPGARERCGNGIDEDLDGTVDETAACPAGDMDLDGQVGPLDCDDNDALAFNHRDERPEVDRCEDGVAQSCVPGGDQSCASDSDGDGYVEPPACEDNAMISPDVPETCNGIDDNCDGTVDEVLDVAAGCVSGILVSFTSDAGHCGACRNICDSVTSDRCESGTCDCSNEVGATGPCTGADPACCFDGCRDLDSDPASCGGCGIVCGEGETCAGGICRCGTSSGAAVGDQACPEALGGGAEANICCGALCRDARADINHCGACDIVCGSASVVCDDRICRCDPASPDRLDCDGDVGEGGNGCETDTLTSVPHCGGCGSFCNPPRASGVCTDGTCNVGSCDSGWGDCNGLGFDGCETSFRSVANCGSCGTVCSLANATETCATGLCRILSCNSGFADCDMNGTSCETPLNTLTDCGSCGTGCSISNANATCATGSCRIASCNSGWDDCDSDGTSCETNLDTTSNCGFCGNTCTMMQLCCSGTCGTC